MGRLSRPVKHLRWTVLIQASRRHVMMVQSRLLVHMRETIGVAKEIHWDLGTMVLSIMMHLVRVLHGCGLITMGHQTHERAPYSVLVAIHAQRLQIMHGSGMAVDQLFRQRYRHLIHHQLHQQNIQQIPLLYPQRKYQQSSLAYLRQIHLLLAPQLHLVYY